MIIDNNSILHTKSLIWIYAISFAILLGLISSVVIVAVNYDIPVAHFTRDPTVILKGHPFTGVVSNIGIVFWCFTSAICLFTSVILFKNKAIKASTFLFFSGALTLFLMTDDLFMLHESIFPGYFSIPENFVYLGYLIFTTLYFVKFRKLILKAEYFTLFLACVFFALSLICDKLLPNEGWEFLVEDGFKLFGIVTWFIFFIRTCFTQVQLVMRSKQFNDPGVENICQ